MPTLIIHTNVKRQNVPADFTKDMAVIVAKALDRDVKGTLIHLNTDQDVSFNGQYDPAGYGVLKSIGRIGVEENKKTAAVIHEFLEKSLGIPKTKFYINFEPILAENVGYNGSTMHGLLS